MTRHEAVTGIICAYLRSHRDKVTAQELPHLIRAADRALQAVDAVAVVQPRPFDRRTQVRLPGRDSPHATS